MVEWQHFFILTVNPTSTTNYWVIATTGICTDTIPHQLYVYKQLMVNKLLNDSICPGTPVKLKVIVIGGKPAYTFLWNNGIKIEAQALLLYIPVLQLHIV